MAGQAQEARSPSGLGRAPTAEKLPAHGSARLLGILTFLPRAIRRELTRTGATDIVLENLGDGYAVLHTDDGDSFRWQGRARVILDRLRRLPNRAGSAAVISEFAEDEGLVAPASPLAPADAEHGYTSDGRTEWETLLPGGTTLYVSGTVSNQGAFYLQFDAIVLLTAPADVLLRRIRNLDRRCCAASAAARRHAPPTRTRSN